MSLEWVDESVAIGDWRDVASVKALRHERIDLILDARPLFVGQRSSRQPLVDGMDRSADLLVELSRRGARVLVRCHHGRDRSPFVAMLYVSKRYGVSYAEAYELVKRRRPRTVLHPEWVEALVVGKGSAAVRPAAKAPLDEPVSPV